METPQLIECTIKTPQFCDGKVHHFHIQSGYFDTESLMFIPHRNMFGMYCGGDHEVHFRSVKQFEKAKIEYTKKWWQIWK